MKERLDGDGRLQDTMRDSHAANDHHRMNCDATLNGSSITFVIVTPTATSALDDSRAISLFEDLQPRHVRLNHSLTVSHVASELVPATTVTALFGNFLPTSILSRAVYMS